MKKKNKHGIKIIKNLEIDCLFDVGANTGQYATLVRSLGYQGQIFSFEPLSSAHKILKEKSSMIISGLYMTVVALVTKIKKLLIYQVIHIPHLF